MALTVSDTPGAIVSKGGSRLTATQRNADGTALTSPDTIHDFGEYKDSTFRDKTPKTPRYNEAGEQVANEEGQRDIGWDCTLQQRDAATIDSIRNATRNAYFITCKKLSENQAVNGKTQWQFSFGQFDSDVEFNLPGGEIPLKFKGLITDTAISLTPGEVTSYVGSTTAILTTVTISAGDWTTIVETTTT